MRAELNLLDYAKELQRGLRETQDLAEPGWRARVESGLARGYRGRNVEGLAAVVHVIVNTLDAAGRFDDALYELDHAETLAQDSPDALAVIRSLRCGFLLAKGRLHEATSATAQVEGMAAEHLRPFARAKLLSTLAVAKLVTMAPGAKDTAVQALADQAVAHDEGARLFIVSWLVPYLAAAGEGKAAVPWVRELRLRAESAGHHWRLADARAFEVVLGVEHDWEPEPKGRPINATAHLRAAISLLRAALLAGDWTLATALADGIGCVAHLLDEAATGRLDNLTAVLEAHRDGVLTTQPALPVSVHLGSLATTLAGAEATAYAGTQLDATRWLGLMDSFPAARFGCEWPVAVDRIRGLLAVRAGNQRLGRKLLVRAGECAQVTGNEVEKLLAQLQLSELLGSGGFVVSERERLSMRRGAWAGLRALGIGTTPHCYVVARSFASASGGHLNSPLSKREVEVLGLLAGGLTYEQVAAALGIRRPTVQTLAHRVYDKLGVSGRMAAVNLARDLGLI